MADLPQSGAVEGANVDNPIFLPDVPAADFENLVFFFYAFAYSAWPAPSLRVPPGINPSLGGQIRHEGGRQSRIARSPQKRWRHDGRSQNLPQPSL
ncbi:hypothetical protein BD626DRAFT_494759, partial [Schizophyllum amplum]